MMNVRAVGRLIHGGRVRRLLALTGYVDEHMSSFATRTCVDDNGVGIGVSFRELKINGL